MVYSPPYYAAYERNIRIAIHGSRTLWLAHHKHRKGFPEIETTAIYPLPMECIALHPSKIAGACYTASLQIRLTVYSLHS